MHVLEKLSNQTKHLSNLCVINDYETIVMCSVNPSSNTISTMPLGERKPLYATAVGKLFMMQFEEMCIRDRYIHIPPKNSLINKKPTARFLI